MKSDLSRSELGYLFCLHSVKLLKRSRLTSAEMATNHRASRRQISVRRFGGDSLQLRKTFTPTLDVIIRSNLVQGKRTYSQTCTRAVEDGF